MKKYYQNENIIGGKYQVIKIIGKGSFGFAKLVKKIDYDGFYNDYYVVKQVNLIGLTQSDKEKARNEMKLLSKLDHPNIIKYHDHIETSNTLYIIMEYADGGDLEQKIERQKAKGNFSEKEILFYFIQIAHAMKYLAEKKILHRDLKTSNIFLTNKGQIKIGDFGISTILQATLAQAQTVCGTPYYFSPEICKRNFYGQKSDVWALGICLYKMATFFYPFNGISMSDLIKNICRGQYFPVPNKNIAHLVNRLLTVDPRIRLDINSILELTIIKQYQQQISRDITTFPLLCCNPTNKNIGGSDVLCDSFAIQREGVGATKRVPHSDEFTLSPKKQSESSICKNIGAQDISKNIGAQDICKNIGAQDISKNIGAQGIEKNIGVKKNGVPFKGESVHRVNNTGQNIDGKNKIPSTGFLQQCQPMLRQLQPVQLPLEPVAKPQPLPLPAPPRRVAPLGELALRPAPLAQVAPKVLPPWVRPTGELAPKARVAPLPRQRHELSCDSTSGAIQREAGARSARYGTKGAIGPARSASSPKGGPARSASSPKGGPALRTSSPKGEPFAVRSPPLPSHTPLVLPALRGSKATQAALRPFPVLLVQQPSLLVPSLHWKKEKEYWKMHCQPKIIEYEEPSRKIPDSNIFQSCWKMPNLVRFPVK